MSNVSSSLVTASWFLLWDIHSSEFVRFETQQVHPLTRCVTMSFPQQADVEGACHGRCTIECGIKAWKGTRQMVCGKGTWTLFFLGYLVVQINMWNDININILYL